MGGLIGAFSKFADPKSPSEITEIKSNTDYITKKLGIKPSDVKQDISFHATYSEDNCSKDPIILVENTPSVEHVPSFSI